MGGGTSATVLCGRSKLGRPGAPLPTDQFFFKCQDFDKGYYRPQMKFGAR